MVTVIDILVDNKNIQKEIHEKNQNAILFEIKEYQQLKVKLLAAKEVKSVSIESFLNPIHLNIGEEYVEVNPKGSQEEALVCGIYELKIIDVKNQIYHYFFKVSPKNVTEDHFLKLKEYLDTYRKNLYLDYFNKTTNANAFIVGNSIVNPYNLKENWLQIDRLLRQIFSNPYYELKKTYETFIDPKKQDARALKKQILSQQMKPAVFVNMNRKINYDVFENQVLKNSVLDYLKDMKSQDARLKKGIAYLKKEIQQKNDLLEKKREEYHQIKYNYAIDVGWKKKKETEISLLEKEVQKLKTKMMNLIGLSRELAHVQSTIDTVLKSPFFQKISPLSSDIKKVKDLRYRNILQRLSLVNDYNQETSKKWNNLGFAIKKSELMFEYFCLFRLFDVLDLLGFQSNQEDFLNTYGINEIPSESEYVFIKDDLKIKIIYDKEIPLFEDCNENDSLYCTTYGPRKPDYIVMLYHKDVFKKALILDAKYRKTKYLYCENERTQVQNTMMHYRLFEYRKSKTENIRTCINQVVVLYPKQEKDIQIKNFTDLDFIPIQISDKQPEDRLITLFENWISD